MRPYEYVKDIPSAIKNLKEQPSNFATQPSDLKLISASPYRASVLVVDTKEANGDNESDQDCDFRNDDISPMSEYKKSRTSPIRDDSQIMRHRCDEYLTQFNPQNQADTTPPRAAHSLSELVMSSSPRQLPGASILKTPKQQEFILPDKVQSQQQQQQEQQCEPEEASNNRNAARNATSSVRQESALLREQMMRRLDTFQSRKC